MRNLVLVFVFSFLSQFVIGAHIVGSDITYECVGQDSFLITVNIYRDCTGISAPTSINNEVSITSPCDTIAPFFTLTNVGSPLSNANNGTQVSQLCSQSLNQSACNGGAYPGIMMLTFESIVVLPPCSLWTIGYDMICCRTTNVNMSSTDAFIQATINNQNDSCNVGPKFSTQPVPYFCAGQTYCYNFGVSEPDGDSLVYALVNGWNAPGQPNNFQFPYTGNAPLIGAVIDPQTGQMCFIPTATGNFVVVVEVCEYDRTTKQLLGCVSRDVIFIVQVCGNQSPQSVGGITNFSGNGLVVDSNSVEICPGNSFQFDVLLWDANPNDSLIISSNLSLVYPNSNISVAYPNAPNRFDTAIVTLTWNASNSYHRFYSFYIEARDNNCPISAINYVNFDVKLNDGIFANEDLIICGNQQAELKAEGGFQYTWTALPGGDPISIGPPGTGNFSCDTCSAPWAYPSSNTCYQVVGNTAGTCKNTDTVCVKVAPDFILTTIRDTLICSTDSLNLFAMPNDSTQHYIINWFPKIGLSLDNTSFTKAKPEISTNYYVFVESDSGCIKSDTVLIALSNPFPLGNAILASDTIICIQDTVNLEVEFGEISYGCEPSNYNCIGNSANYSVGSGANTNSPISSFNNNQGIPTFFAGDDNSVRQQFLFRASELTAAGMTQGVIESISFNIISNNGPSVYDNYQIKLGCTNQNRLKNSNWVNGLSTVFNPKSVNPVIGLNTLYFDTPYQWDGNSNLVLEICFSNNGSSQNALVQQTFTTFESTSYFRSQFSVCNTQGQDNLSPINRRPNIQFGLCSGINKSAFNYHWYDAVNLISSASQNNHTIDMVVNLTSPSVYNLAISDSIGACRDTVSVRINAVQSYDITPNSVGPFCETSPFVYMSAFTPGGVWSGPGIQDSLTGLFFPGNGGAGLGNHKIFYEIKGNQCGGKDSTTISVIAPPNTTITTLGPFCELDTLIEIKGISSGFVSSSNPSVAAGIQDSTGFINLAKIPNIYDSIPLVWTAIGAGCSKDTSIIISLSKPFDASITGPTNICPSDSLIRFYQIDTLLGGNWSGQGIVDAKLGIFDVSIFTGGQIMHVVLDSSGFCGDRDTFSITVDTLPKISFFTIAGGLGPWCKNDSSNVIFDATPYDNPANSGSGNWLHLKGWLNGGVNNTTPIVAFSTSALFPKVGNHASVYFFEDLNGCKSQDTLNVQIFDDPGKLNISINGNQDSVFSNIKDGYWYEWFLNGNPIASSSDRIGQPLVGSGDYHLKLYHPCDTLISNSVYFENVGLNNLNKNVDFQVYPNPSNGQFTLSIPQDLVGQKAQIFNQLGQLVWEQVLNHPQAEITGLPKGVYLLQLMEVRQKIIFR